MKRITIYLGEKDDMEIENKLKFLAYKQNKSMSQIIKDILYEKLKNVKIK